MGKQTTTQLTEAEMRSGVDRGRFAELLIRQLPANHDGRNSGLLNYGTGPDVDAMRKKWEKATGKTFPPAGGMVAMA
jgi:hypothetical protein